MARFSERYGYVKPNDIIVRECITEPIRNSICNWLNLIRTEIRSYKEMVYSMRLLVQFLQRMEDEKVMVHIDDYSNRAAMNTAYGDYVQIINEILKRVKEDSYKKALETELNTYVKTMNSLVNRKCLEKIEKYCKVI